MPSAYKTVSSDATPEDIMSMVESELEELATEIGEWRDGMSGTNLESSEKYQQLDELANALESYSSPTPDEWPHHEARVSYSESVPKRKTRRASRQVRLSNAIGKAQSLVEFYRSLDDDLEEICEEIESAISELEGLEVPGMYG